MKKLWGMLVLDDGTEVTLEGQSVKVVKKLIGKRKIVDYGRKDLGDEANVYDEVGDKLYATITAVRRLFQRSATKLTK